MKKIRGKFELRFVSGLAISGKTRILDYLILAKDGMNVNLEQKRRFHHLDEKTNG